MAMLSSKIKLPDDFSLEANGSTNVNVVIELYQSIDHGSGLKDTELTIPASIVTIDSDGSRDARTDIKIYDGKDPAFSIVGISYR
ncbi:hypothetical protein O9993_00755 [Vibrio lentus]|nr:hypothetical protein [Vibrio lentus]